MQTMTAKQYKVNQPKTDKLCKTAKIQNKGNLGVLQN